jgi:tyrosine-protein kinase Etk/Wzc
MSDRHPNNLFRLLEVMAARRTLILSLIVIGTVLSIVTALVLPKWYKGEALLLPPKEQTIKAAGLSELAEVTSVAGGLNLPVLVTASDLYARMLKSHAICDTVIQQFNLRDRYNASNFTETYVELMDRAKFRVTDEGLLSIAVEDRDPQMAANLANAFVDQLTALDQKISSSRATQNRRFVEERLARVKTQLDSSRAALEDFQRTNRAVDFDEQTRLAISQATDLKVSLAKTDLEVKALERVVGEDNPDLMEKKSRLQILKKQLEDLEKGGKDSSYFSLPVSRIPALKGRYELLYSNVKVNEGLYETLLSLLEQSKVQEGSVSTTLSVLDRARVPELRSRPQRSLIVLAGFGFSVILALLLASVLEYLRRLEETSADDYRRAMRFIDAFLGWLPGVKRR